MNIRNLFALYSLLLVLSSSQVFADAWNVTVNTDFVKHAKFSEKAEVAMLSLTLESHTTDNINYTYDSRIIEFRQDSPNGKIIRCTFHPKQKGWVFDCGLEAMSLGAYDINYVWTFALKKTEGNWIEIYKDHNQKDMLWLDKRTLKKDELKVIPIVMWLTSESGIAPLKENDLAVYRDPSDSSTVSRCAPTYFGWEDEGWKEYEQQVYGFVVSGISKGDWIGGHCSTPDCYSDKTPFACEQPIKDQIEKILGKKLGNCIEGWVRWRSTDGHLLVYPKTSQPWC